MSSVVVGAGDISQVHLAALESMGVEVAAVVDHDLEKAAAKAPAGAQTFDDVAAALSATGADVVHVCTPHDQHLPVVLAALEAGVHVLCEKPLAHRLEDAETLAAAAAASPSRVGVCFQNRYNPTSRAMREVLDGGELGAPVSATATVAWSRPEPYYANKRWAGQRERAGGGALINQSIHTIDLVQWLLGPVTAIAGQAYRLEEIPGVDVEDTATIALHHDGPSGPVRSSIWATNAHAVNDPVTIEIRCERGSLLLRDGLSIAGPDGVRTVTDTPADGERSYWGTSHRDLIADFYAGLGQPGEFWIDPAAALPAQRVLDAVYTASGRAV